MDVRRDFSRNVQRQHFAKISQVADDAMQKYARETLSLTTRPHHKEDALCYNNGHKNALRWQQ